MADKINGGADDTARNEQLVNVLLKDYELAASRFDKTDDRIIQLISVGLALFGFVVVLVRQAPASSSGTTTFPTFLQELFGHSDRRSSIPRNLDSDVWLACLLFAVVYFILSALCVLLWYRGSKKVPEDKEDAMSSPSAHSSKDDSDSPQVSGDNQTAAKKSSENKPDASKPGSPNPYIVPPSLWATWFLGIAIGLACIIIIGLCVRPTLNTEPSSRVPLELLWLAPLSLVIFHALLIYVLNSAFGLLWYCRALSKRITNVLNSEREVAQSMSNGAQEQAPKSEIYLPVLMRFDRGLTPSIFFSFGRGNVKPRTVYILLLGTIGFLFMWVTVAAFIQIYASHWWEGAFMLSIYFALEFTVVFALSGVGHDLEKTHKDFVQFVDDESRYKATKINRPAPKADPIQKQPDAGASQNQAAKD
jgi:hypothetical protein